MAQTESAINSPALNVSLARMTEHDLIEVVEIEQICGLSPWGWEAYHREINAGPGAIMLLAPVSRGPAEGKRIAGFIISRVVADELHVNNVAVRPEYQRLGIGARLLTEALSQAVGQGARSAFLEVRASNRSAQALYRRCGFQPSGHRTGYYRNPPEDALMMSVVLGA